MEKAQQKGIRQWWTPKLDAARATTASMKVIVWSTNAVLVSLMKEILWKKMRLQNKMNAKSAKLFSEEQNIIKQEFARSLVGY